MPSPLHSADVFIAGAGPVGMLLALLLEQDGLSVVLADPRTSVNRHSRAVGIHPPGLAALEKAGLADRFVAESVTVTGGVVYVDGRYCGRMSFGDLEGKWKHPVILPQFRTEELLEDAVRARRGIQLNLGWSVEEWETGEDGLVVRCGDDTGAQMHVFCRWLIGCDGKRSRVRTQAGIGWNGRTYPDRYWLGDFSDGTAYGTDAMIHLHRDGLVESFPLPGGLRRWVSRRQEQEQGREEEQERSRSKSRRSVPGVDHHASQKLCEAVLLRSGDYLDAGTCLLAGGFGIERGLAGRFVSGRIILAGDAAHVVSPIGGQGMNLGWMDAVDLAKSLGRSKEQGLRSTDQDRDKEDREDREDKEGKEGMERVGDQNPNREASRFGLTMQRLLAYERRARKRAKTATRRAWFNTLMGRAGWPSWLRRAVVRLMLSRLLRRRFAEVFTMGRL